MTPPDIELLREHCSGRLESRVLAAEEAEQVVVGGAERLLITTSDAGQGVAFSWSTTTWLVDVSSCKALGMVAEGGEGSLRTSVTLTACPGDVDQRFLLDRAGYAPSDPTRPSLDSMLPERGGPTREEAVGGLVVRAQGTAPPDWHDGTPPASFPASWVATTDGACPSYSVHHADQLRHAVAAVPGGRLHTYWDFRLTGRSDPSETHSILEDTHGHRWSVVSTREPGAHPIGDSAGGRKPVAPPRSLRRWEWSQEPAVMDPGIPRVVACTPSGFACTTFDLRLDRDWPDHVRWSPDGLLVFASEDDSTPILVGTDLLLSLLAVVAPHRP